MTHANAPTLTIDLTALAANYRQLAARAGNAATAAAVKADAYGLSMAQVAPALAQAGCRHFYVAHLSEALALRSVLSDVAIGVLHGIPANEAALAQEQRLTPVLSSLAAIADWQAVAQQRGSPLPVIIHLDTGMNRLGLPAAEVAQLAAAPERLTGLQVQFWMSHLACADEPEHPLNQMQLALLQEWLLPLPSAPVSFANSSGIFLGTHYHFNQVRPGCALYGINPTPQQPNPMRAVARLTAPILQLRPLLSGASVGYSASWQSPRAGRLAVMPLGYADGFLRSLSNRGTVYFGDHAAPIVGRVSMDLITVDVTDVPEALCQPGDMGELFGTQQDVDAVATAAGTIGYEILTSLGTRYRRVYTS